jgi:nucleoside-diphosphate-sugar epimerase
MQQELINSIRRDCEKSLVDYLESFSSLRNQAILITGGTGFMGKWLAEAICLLNEQYDFNIKLHLLARNIQEYKEKVPHLAKQKFINLIEEDVRNVTTLPDEITFIIHAAGSPDNRKHISTPLKTIDIINKGTQAILDTCLRLPNLNKFIQISSNYVYGHQNEGHLNIKETEIGISDPNSVNSAYSEAKRMAETICAVYRNQKKLPIVIVRPFAFIGPYQELEKPWAINNFIRDSILGGPIRILGNENTIRSYLYGSDMAFWLLKILAEGKIGSTYNLGSEQAISLKDLSKNITMNFNNKIEILVKSSKTYPLSPIVSVPDNTHIKSDLQVKQAFELESALKRTINWYKQIDQPKY